MSVEKKERKPKDPFDELDPITKAQVLAEGTEDEKIDAMQGGFKPLKDRFAVHNGSVYKRDWWWKLSTQDELYHAITTDIQERFPNCIDGKETRVRSNLLKDIKGFLQRELSVDELGHFVAKGYAYNLDVVKNEFYPYNKEGEIVPTNELDHPLNGINIFLFRRVESEKKERFNTLIDEWCNYNEARKRRLNIALGTCLDPRIQIDKVILLLGTRTRNGKSTFVRGLLNALGDYATTIDINSIRDTRKKNGGSNPTPDMASMEHKRLAVFSECGEHETLDQGKLKELTGGDAQRARILYSNGTVFIPRAKLLMTSNFPIIDRDGSLEKSKRIYTINFENQFSNGADDKSLREYVASEDFCKCMLDWLYEGLREFYKNGEELPDNPEVGLIVEKRVESRESYVYHVLSNSLRIDRNRYDITELYKRGTKEDFHNIGSIDRKCVNGVKNRYVLTVFEDCNLEEEFA